MKDSEMHGIGQIKEPAKSDVPPKQKPVSLLSDEELNASIATTCGWTFVHRVKSYLVPRETIAIQGYKPTALPYCVTEKVYECVPDYCKDLNAMHTAEKVMSVDQAIRFRLLLSANSGKRNTKYISVEAAMCHAEARERAEAFVTTMKGAK